MSKSESICRVAFHHSEAIRANAVFGTARSFGKSPVLKMFYSDTVVLLRFLPEDVSGKRRDSRGTNA
jgi:hypothetical protein